MRSLQQPLIQLYLLLHSVVILVLQQGILILILILLLCPEPASRMACLSLGSQGQVLVEQPVPQMAAEQDWRVMLRRWGLRGVHRCSNSNFTRRTMDG